MDSSKYIDDRTPSIHYLSGDWSRVGARQDYLGSATVTRTKGAAAAFNFTGSLISVHGRLNQLNTGEHPSSSSYQIDGGDAVNQRQNTNATTYRALFYTSSLLSEGPHTLIVTNENDGALILDFFIVTSKQPLASPSPTPSPTGIDSSPSQEANRTSSKGPIIGGAIGGVMLLTIVLGLVVFMWKKRRSKREVFRKTQDPIPYNLELDGNRPTRKLQNDSIVDSSMDSPPQDSNSRHVEMAQVSGLLVDAAPETNESYYSTTSSGNRSRLMRVPPWMLSRDQLSITTAEMAPVPPVVSAAPPPYQSSP